MRAWARGGIALAALVAALGGLSVGQSASAAVRATATWHLSSTRAGSLAVSTVTIRPTARVTVTAMSFSLPPGAGGALTVHSAYGLGPGTLRIRYGTVIYALTKPIVIPLGRTVSLVLLGWRNPATAGYEQLRNVALRLISRTSVVAPPTAALLIQGAIGVATNATTDTQGAHVQWTLHLPAAPAYSRLTFAVPHELAGAPYTTTVTGLPDGSTTRDGDAITYTFTSPATIAPSSTPTLTANWSRAPSSVRDIPLAVTAGTATVNWATGGTRTPAGLEPSTCGAYRQPGWVTVENALPADASWSSGSWLPSAPAGWLSDVSAQCGDRLALHVSSARAYRVLAYRMGWYGGSGARLVWESSGLPAYVGAAPTTDPSTYMVETHWPTAATITIGTGWVPGDYLFKLVDSAGLTSFIPLTVRDDASTSALLVQNAVLTWQAYNHWGGSSLYNGTDGLTADRARVVSFDRPYDGQELRGAAWFLGDEYPFVRFAEKNGLDVSYWTDLDLVRQPSLLNNHRTLVMTRHSEYWTQAMRDSVTSARDNNGMNLMFLGADNMYWRARLADSPTGSDRHEVVYRVANQDPDQASSDISTGFRYDPINNPEQRLVGTEYDCMRADAPMTITDNAAGWILSGTSLVSGSQLPNLVFNEFDRYYDNTGAPPVEVIAHSPLSCAADNESQTYSDMTYYTTTSGAGVFATGTFGWLPALDGYGSALPLTDSERQAVQRMTLNILSVFAAGPAGKTNPAVPNSTGIAIGALQPFQPDASSGDEDAQQVDSIPRALWSGNSGSR